MKNGLEVIEDRMSLKENCGVDPISLRQGYKKLPYAGGEREHDNNLPASPALAETDSGGFLGRDESTTSESSKL